ncbi:MAG: dTDP-4-dehydrorhamnose 3,5-epimerase [Candidatus Hodarchaeota archaeon]
MGTKLKFFDTDIKDVYIIKPDPFIDHRGMFARVFCKEEFKEISHDKEIVNINHSATKIKGSIRGMHFQNPPKAEIKIIKCIKGSIFDVAIDLRKNSPTFLKHHSEILSAKNMKMLYVPEGFAHGFQSLEDDVEMIYYTTEFYSPESENGVRYSDPKIAINWPLDVTDISEKDNNLKLLTDDFEGLEV